MYAMIDVACTPTRTETFENQHFEHTPGSQDYDTWYIFMLSLSDGMAAMVKKKFVHFRNRSVWMDPKEVLRLVSTGVIKCL